MTILKRLVGLFFLLWWTLTIGIVGMLMWFFVLILLGHEAADRWHTRLRNSGEPLIELFFS